MHGEEVGLFSGLSKKSVNLRPIDANFVMEPKLKPVQCENSLIFVMSQTIAEIKNECENENKNIKNCLRLLIASMEMNYNFSISSCSTCVLRLQFKNLSSFLLPSRNHLLDR